MTTAYQYPPPPPAPPRPSRGLRLPVVLLSALGVVALAGAIVVAVVAGGGDGPGPGPQPTTSAGPGPSSQRGLIWEDTLGKDFYDPDVEAWWRPCGFTGPQRRNLCREQGWELKLDEQLRVSWVVLYTAEDNGTIDEYTGPLPYGLSWTDTYPEIVERLGQPSDLSGGYGVAVHADYADLGPYFVQIDLTVLHQYDDITTAGIKDIYVTTNP